MRIAIALPPSINTVIELPRRGRTAAALLPGFSPATMKASASSHVDAAH